MTRPLLNFIKEDRR